MQDRRPPGDVMDWPSHYADRRRYTLPRYKETRRERERERERERGKPYKRILADMRYTPVLT